MERDKNNKKFHLTITDNETSKVIKDLDIVAMVGALHTGEDSFAQGLFLSYCNKLTTAETVKSVEYVLEKAYGQDPLLRLLTAAMDGKEEANN